MEGKIFKIDYIETDYTFNKELFLNQLCLLRKVPQKPNDIIINLLNDDTQNRGKYLSDIRVFKDNSNFKIEAKEGQFLFREVQKIK